MKCYIINEKTKEFYSKKDFEKDYLNDIRKIDTWKEKKKQGDIYNDPDGIYNISEAKKIGNKEFYKDLAIFLNNRESKYNKKYYYKANEDKIDVFENGKMLFSLKSDQFGFSAPSINKNHPYDTYLFGINGDKKPTNDEIIKVCDWIYNSRTLFGSFLWDIDLHKNNYNLLRGGSKKYGNYIEDRVDLTLLEIKLYYDYYRKSKNEESFKKTKLYLALEKCKDKKSIWLEHFKDFEEYIKFMCFDDFINNSNNPIDIINANLSYIEENNFDKSKLQFIKDSEAISKKKGIYKDGELVCKDLEKMFNNVKWLINRRYKCYKNN